jgi:hypothetical protein
VQVLVYDEAELDLVKGSNHNILDVNALQVLSRSPSTLEFSITMRDIANMQKSTYILSRSSEGPAVATAAQTSFWVLRQRPTAVSHQ